MHVSISSTDKKRVVAIRHIARLSWRSSFLRDMAVPPYRSPRRVCRSFDRWNAPTEKAFDFKSQNIFDIFGELGWFFRAVPSSNEQIRQFLKGPLMTFLMTPSESDTGSKGGLPDLLDTTINYIAAALLLIPVFTAWLAAAIPAFTLAAKFRLLELSKHGQDLCYHFREELLRWLLQTVTKAAKTVWAFTTAFLKIVTDQVHFYIKFAAAFGVLLLINLKAFLEKLVDLFNSWIETVRVFQRVLAIVMRFEINGLAGWVGSFLPRVTIDDLVSVALGYARGWLKAALQTALDEALIAAYVIDNDELKVQIRALKEIFQIVLTPTPEMKGEPLLISPGDLFPDISGLLASGLGAAIRKHGSEVAAGLTATLASGGAAVIAAGEAFRTAGARAAFIDSPAKFQKIFDDSAAVADYLTQGERSALQERLAKPDELAAGFEKALIGGGFDIVGDCISFYLKAVREHWDQNLKSPARAAKPTSPHILQKRKSLGRVRLPALTVTARGYKLDSDLITEIASRFKTAVQEAYRKGMVRPEAAPAQ